MYFREMEIPVLQELYLLYITFLIIWEKKDCFSISFLHLVLLFLLHETPLHSHRAHYSLLQQPRRRHTHTQMQQKRMSSRNPAAPAIKMVIFKGSERRGERLFCFWGYRLICKHQLDTVLLLEPLTVNNFELLGHTAFGCPHTVGGLTAVHPWVQFRHTLKLLLQTNKHKMRDEVSRVTAVCLQVGLHEYLHILLTSVPLFVSMLYGVSAVAVSALLSLYHR